MAKPLTFRYDGADIEFEMHKVDRSKLYGYKELEVLDENGDPCELTTLADDGKTLVGKGGTGIGYLDADGNWCDKTQLKPIDLEGNEIEPVKSSFAAPIPLQRKITIDEYLEHNIRLSYQLKSDSVPTQLQEQLAEGVIFAFPYSYRGGLVSDTGFLLNNDEGELFFLVGDAASLDFKSLQTTAGAFESDENQVDSDDDGELMDFGMI